MMVEQTLAADSLSTNMWAWHVGITIIAAIATVLAIARGAVASSRQEPFSGRVKCLIWAATWFMVFGVHASVAWGQSIVMASEMYFSQIAIGLSFAATQLISFVFQDTETSRRKIAKTVVVSTVPDVKDASIVSRGKKKLADSQVAFRVVPVPEPGQSPSALMQKWSTVMSKNSKQVQLV